MERVSSAEQANESGASERASDPVLKSRFMVFMNHSGIERREDSKSREHGDQRAGSIGKTTLLQFRLFNSRLRTFEACHISRGRLDATQNRERRTLLDFKQEPRVFSVFGAPPFGGKRKTAEMPVMILLGCNLSVLSSNCYVIFTLQQLSAKQECLHKFIRIINILL